MTFLNDHFFPSSLTSKFIDFMLWVYTVAQTNIQLLALCALAFLCMIVLVLCFLIGDDGNDVGDDGEEGGL
jgi:heme/copper-type cytochrome/quinol oxidase subunit 4